MKILRLLAILGAGCLGCLSSRADFNNLGSMALQNFNNVGITGGSIANVTFKGTITLGSGAGNGGVFAFLPYEMPALAIDVTQALNTVILTGADAGSPNEALTFSATPGIAGTTFSVLILNQDSVVHVPTFPSSFSFNLGATTTSLKIQPSSYVWLTYKYDGTNYYLSGDPRTVDDLSAYTTPTTADEIGVYKVSGSNGVMFKSTLGQAGLTSTVKAITFTLNGSGAALTTGLKSGTFIKIPYAGTLIGWALVASPSGSITIDVDGVANGSGLPTTGNSIVGAGTKPATSSAVENSSTTLTGWTTSLTALENLAVNVTAADGTVQYATLVLYYQ